VSVRPAAFAATPLPRTIGKYVVSHVIGEGAMGVVYKAVDPFIQRSVAVKTIRQPLLAQLNTTIDETAFKTAWNAGQALTLEQALEYAQNMNEDT